MSRLFSFFVTLSLFYLGNASTAVFTTTFYDTYAGLSVNISWKGALPPSNITLENGTTAHIDYDIVIDIPGSNGYYLWSIPLNLPTNTYSFNIGDSSNYQGVNSYSNYFNITQRNSSVGAFVKPTPAIFADSATATSFNVSSTSSSAAPSGRGPTASGLSGGAKVGIGVGAAFVVLAVIGLVVFWYRKRSGTPMPQVAGVTDPYSKAELPGSMVGQKIKAGASADFQKVELGTGPDKVGMGHGVERVELESDNPQAELGG
ncbi:hypothetical protein BDZ45DRAFT_734100 [Acephala macrosclerotiorum]|nr:hypothetical protein BDZ45DRAFT_734100 [Acephala macrosclerotiorum]